MSILSDTYINDIRRQITQLKRGFKITLPNNEVYRIRRINNQYLVIKEIGQGGQGSVGKAIGYFSGSNLNYKKLTEKQSKKFARVFKSIKSDPQDLEYLRDLISYYKKKIEIEEELVKNLNMSSQPDLIVDNKEKLSTKNKKLEDERNDTITAINQTFLHVPNDYREALEQFKNRVENDQFIRGLVANRKALSEKPRQEILKNNSKIEQRKIVILQDIVNKIRVKKMQQEVLHEAELTPHSLKPQLLRDGLTLQLQEIPGKSLEMLMSDGSLNDLTGDQQVILTLKILEAVQNQVVSLGYIHFDIKPANIMVDLPLEKAPGEPVITIIDFGLAEVAQSRHNIANLKGSLPYIAPEILKETEGMGKFTNKVDAYSTAVTLIKLLATTDTSTVTNVTDLNQVLGRGQDQRLSENLKARIDNNSYHFFPKLTGILRETLITMTDADQGLRSSIEHNIFQIKKDTLLKLFAVDSKEHALLLQIESYSLINQLYFLEKTKLDDFLQLDDKARLVLREITHNISHVSKELQQDWHPAIQKKGEVNSAIAVYQQAVFASALTYLVEKRNIENRLSSFRPEQKSAAFKKNKNTLEKSLSNAYQPLKEKLALERHPKRALVRKLFAAIIAIIGINPVGHLANKILPKKVNPYCLFKSTASEKTFNEKVQDKLVNNITLPPKSI